MLYKENFLKYLVSGAGLLSLILLLLRVYNLNNGLDTIYDQGYLLLKLREVSYGIGEQGVSQWPVIVTKLVGIDLSKDIVGLKIIEILVQLLAVSFLCAAVILFLRKNHHSRNSFLEILLGCTMIYALLLNLGELIFYYNPIQQSLFHLIVGAIVLYSFNKAITRRLILLLVGILSVFTIMNILPSGVIVLVYVAIYVTIYNRQSPSTIFTELGFMLMGLVIGIVFYHFFVSNLFEVINQMRITAESLTKSNRGYDSFSFIMKYLVYGKDLCLALLPLTLLVYITFRIRKYSFPISILCIILSLYGVVEFWPWNKAIESTLILFPGLMLTFVSLLNYKDNKNREDILLVVFLLFFPFLALLGTNTYYGSKILWFILPWSIIPIMILHDSKIQLIKQNIVFFSTVLVCFLGYFPVKNALNEPSNHSNYKKYGLITSIKITERQNRYFELVDYIIGKYHYQPEKDYMFATQLDHMTIFVLKGIPNSTYFQPTDFLVDPYNKKLKVPRFIFMTKYDLAVLGTLLPQLNWGFPEKYDRYYLGTPEQINTGYSTDRWLFCRKNK